MEDKNRAENDLSGPEVLNLKMNDDLVLNGRSAEDVVEQASKLLRTGKSAQSEALLKDLLSGQPKCRPALELLGRILMNRKNFEEAAVVHQVLLEATGSTARSHNYLGVSLMMASDPDSALPHLEKSVDMEPFNRAYLANLGKFWMVYGQWEKAVPYLERALESAEPSRRYQIQELLDECESRLDKAAQQAGYPELSQ